MKFNKLFCFTEPVPYVNIPIGNIIGIAIAMNGHNIEMFDLSKQVEKDNPIKIPDFICGMLWDYIKNSSNKNKFVEFDNVKDVKLFKNVKYKDHVDHNCYTGTVYKVLGSKENDTWIFKYLVHPHINIDASIEITDNDIKAANIYWFISTEGRVCNAVENDKSKADEFRRKSGNYYNTYEAAKNECDNIWKQK